MNRSLFPLWCALLLFAPLRADAAEWVSPDGKIAFRQPPAARFNADASVPSPGLARWMTPDGLTIVVIVRDTSPSDEPLEQSGLVEGTLKQFQQGRLISSSRTVVSGIPAYIIIATGNMSGIPRFLAQVIVA